MSNLVHRRRRCARIDSDRIQLPGGQYARGQALLILPRIRRIGRIGLRILGARQKLNKPLAVDARCLLRAIDAVPV